jgi:hypothetical protein
MAICAVLRVLLGLDPSIGISAHNQKKLDGGQYALRMILGSSPRMTGENIGRQ